MRLLLDNNLSPRLVALLADHDVEHVRTVGLQAATDEVVLAHAVREERVLVSADTDFGRILASTRASGPPSSCCDGILVDLLKRWLRC